MAKGLVGMGKLVYELIYEVSLGRMGWHGLDGEVSGLVCGTRGRWKWEEADKCILQTAKRTEDAR